MDVLGPLDYPRQALANLARGGYRVAGGTATLSDLLGMAPGALGAVVGGLTLSPFAGSAAGGLAQGLGRLTGHEAFDAPSVGDVVEGVGGDRDSLWQNLLAQTLTDPMTLSAGGKLAAANPWRQEAQLAGLAGDLKAGLGGVDSALAARAAQEAQAVEREVAAARRLLPLDLPGIAAGRTVDFPVTGPGVTQAALERGVGFPLPGEGIPSAGAWKEPVRFHGSQIPAAAGFEYGPRPVRGPIGGRMAGKGPVLNPAMQAADLPRPLTDFDREFLAQFQGQTLTPPGTLMSQQEAAAGAEALGQALGARANAAVPVPTLGAAMEQNPLLGQLLGGRSGVLPTDLPLGAARAQISGDLGLAQQALAQRRMTPRDWALVAGAGGYGVGQGLGLGR